LRRPKSLIYAQEGLKQVDRQLILGFQYLTHLDQPLQKNQECPVLRGYLPSILNSFQDHLKLLLDIKIEINLLLAQISIVRSDFLIADQVCLFSLSLFLSRNLFFGSFSLITKKSLFLYIVGTQLLVEMIKTVCESSRWETYRPRIAFLKSMLSHATGNLPSARQSLLTTLFLATQHAKASHPSPVGQVGYMSDLSTLAKTCYVLLRLAEKTEDRSLPPSSSGTTTLFNSENLLVHPTNDFSRSFAVDRIIAELASSVKLALPHLSMAIHVVLAISCGEIVKAKFSSFPSLYPPPIHSKSNLSLLLTS
jgi:hypothetical protein